MSKRFTYGDQIEELFREGFSDYRVSPSARVWKGINARMNLRQFFRFNPASFNVYYAVAVVTAGITGAVFLSSPGKTAANQESPAVVVTDHSPRKEQVKRPAEIKAGPSKESHQPAETPETSRMKQEIPAEKHDEPQAERSERALATEQPVRKDVAVQRKAGGEEKAVTKPVINKSGDQKALQMAGKPIARFESSHNQGCTPLSVQFTSKSVFADSVLWYFGDGGSSRERTVDYVFDQPGKYVVSHTAVNRNGSSTTRSLVRVHERPEARFEISPDEPGIPEKEVRFLNYSRNANRFEWSFGDGGRSSAFEPVHRYQQWDNYNVALIVWSEYGCSDTLLVKNAYGTSNCRIDFPNAFMPNMNGPTGGYFTEGVNDNEVFHPVCQGVVEYQLKVFSRTGVLIFQSNDVRHGWDGYLNGQLVESGVYIWKVRGTFSNGKTFVESGDVTVVYR